MSRTGCVICTHKKAAQINERLINKPHSGESFQIIADYFGVSQTTLQNHYKGNPDKNEPSHISELLSKSVDAKETLKADNTFSEYQKAKTRIEDLSKKTYDLLAKAEVADNHNACIGYIREARAQEGELREQRKFVAELEGKIAAQAQVNVQVNVLQSPEWIAHESRIIKALEAFPQAREVIVNALR